MSSLNSDLGSINSTAGGWVTHGRNIALWLSVALLIIDVAWLSAKWLLFGSDISAVVGPLTMRVFTVTIFQLAIVNSDQVFAIITSFVQSAQYLGGGIGIVDTIGHADIATACVVGVAAGAMHASDATAPSAFDTFLFPIPPLLNMPNGLILTGSAVSAAHFHDTQIAVTFFLAMVLLGCAAAIYLTYFLLFAENYIVMLGGIVMLGFSGASMTQQFATGYVRYAVYAGARLFFFYLILAIEQAVIFNVLSGVTTVVGLLAASAFGPQSVLVIDGELVAAGIAIMQLVILTSLVMFVPQIAGAALSGNTSLNAGDFLRSISASVTQAQGAVSSLSSSLKNTKTPGDS